MSITTNYNGIRFRSRLEATWAAFYDQLKWDWEYEPIDFNGWIPDFGIKKTDNTFLWVEVKPFTLLKQWKSEKKIIDNLDKGVLMCGLNLEYPHYPKIGFISDEYSYEIDSCLIGEISAEYIYKNKVKYDLFGIDGGWNYRLSGIYDGNGHLKKPEENTIKEFWKTAKNDTQWKK